MVTANLNQMIQRSWIEQAYTGREEGCRCGCHGNYFDKGTRGFARALNKAFKLNPEIVLCDSIAETNERAALTQKAVAADGVPRGYAYATSTNGIDWVDIVLDGRYPYLNTITLYTTR